MDTNSKISKIVGIVGIASALMVITYKGIYGMRAGMETLMPFMFVALAATIVSVVLKREIISWISVGITIIALVFAYFL